MKAHESNKNLCNEKEFLGDDNDIGLALKNKRTNTSQKISKRQQTILERTLFVRSNKWVHFHGLRFVPPGK